MPPLSAEKIETFRKRLVEERELLAQDFAGSRSSYQDLVNQDNAGDLVDQAYNRYEKDLLIGLSDREKHTMRKIDAALLRVEKGEYGVCEITGADIEEERLDAIPYTTLCQAEAVKRSRQRFVEEEEVSYDS